MLAGRALQAAWGGLRQSKARPIALECAFGFRLPTLHRFLDINYYHGRGDKVVFTGFFETCVSRSSAAYASHPCSTPWLLCGGGPGDRNRRSRVTATRRTCVCASRNRPQPPCGGQLASEGRALC